MAPPVPRVPPPPFPRPFPRLRDEFDDVLDNRVIPNRDHPAGSDALVWSSGAPTEKLVALCRAIHLWLNWEVPLPNVGLIESRRLYILESWTENNGLFYTYKEEYHANVFEELGMEFAWFFDEVEQCQVPGLTLKGLVRYITLWVLCEPLFATEGLRKLIAVGNFPAPPAPYGATWTISASQALGVLHPNAQERRLELHELTVDLVEESVIDKKDWSRLLWEH